MPFVRINHPAGKPPAFRAAISRGVYRAMLDTFDVPTDDLFQVLSESGPGTEMVRPQQYLGIKYSDDLIFIQITCNDTRTVDQKKALYAAIADNLARAPAFAAKTFSSVLSRSGRRTGRSATASRNTRRDYRCTSPCSFGVVTPTSSRTWATKNVTMATMALHAAGLPGTEVDSRKNFMDEYSRSNGVAKIGRGQRSFLCPLH